VFGAFSILRPLLSRLVSGFQVVGNQFIGYRLLFRFLIVYFLFLILFSFGFEGFRGFKLSVIGLLVVRYWIFVIGYSLLDIGY